MREYEAHRKSEDALRRCIDVIYRVDDTEAAVERVLAIVAKYYGAERCYMFEADESINAYRKAFYWQGADVADCDQPVETVDFSVLEKWFDNKAVEGEIMLDSIDEQVDKASELYMILKSRDINTILATPIRMSRKIKGFLCIDNYVKTDLDSFLLRSVSVILYSEIVRRRQIIDKEKEAEKQKKQIELDRSIIEVLAYEYSSAFVIDFETDAFTPIRLDDSMRAHFGNMTSLGYTPCYRTFTSVFISESDREEMFEAGSVEYLREALKDKTSAFRRYRCILHGKEEIFESKYVKVGKAGAKPRFVVLGIAIRDSEAREAEKREMQLKDANRRAEEANRAKSTFLFNMSHDIRTPMNAIIGYTEMASQAKDDPKRQEDYFNKVRIANNQLMGLVNDVLDMARIESGKVTIEESPQNIVVSTNNTFQLLKNQALDKELNITSEYRNIEHSRVFCDELRLNRIFMNIIGNSIKYTKPGGQVRFIVEEIPHKKKGHARFKFTVTDTGIGMSKAFQQHLFEAFSREHTTTSIGIEGTGLGMLITKELVDMMGGTIDVESELGTGTLVSIKLEFRIADVEEEAPTEVNALNEADLEYKRVLLVEDNDMNREIARNILESRRIIVEEATDGSVAVEMVLAKAPDYYDYVLMDIQMPYMDGYMATKTIRSFADAKFSKLPIIAMTANAFAEDRDKAIAAGMDAHLAKPINVKELFRVLKKFS